MAQQRNLLTVLGCSGSLALMLSAAPAALANPTEAPADIVLPSLTQADENPIMDSLSCSCARCVMGRVDNL